MKEIIKKAIQEGMKDHGGGVDHYAKIIEKHLVEAGYGKVDPKILSAIDHFRHAVGSLQENLRVIMNKTDLLSLSDEKCTQLLNIIDQLRNRA